MLIPGKLYKSTAFQMIFETPVGVANDKSLMMYPNEIFMVLNLEKINSFIEVKILLRNYIGWMLISTPVREIEFELI